MRKKKELKKKNDFGIKLEQNASIIGSVIRKKSVVCSFKMNAFVS